MNKERKVKKYRELGHYYYYKNVPKNAIIYFLKYIKIINDDESIFMKISECFIELGELDIGLVYINKGLELSCGNYKLLELKFDTLTSLGRNREAEEYLQKIKKIDEFVENYELDLSKFYNEK